MLVSPKSQAGVRDVPLDPEDVRVLIAHRRAVGGRPGDFVSSAGSGRPIDAVAAWRHIRARIVCASGIAEPVPRFHDVRHAWAITMLRAGMRPEPLARLGGWSEVSIIHRRYGKHALPGELEDAGRALADYRAGRRRRARGSERTRRAGRQRRRSSR